MDKKERDFGYYAIIIILGSPFILVLVSIFLALMEQIKWTH